MTEVEPCPIPSSVQSPDPSSAEMEESRSPSDCAASPSSMQGSVVSEDVLNQLSRQLEYYFSTVNLSRDTYLRTLRELNDGYVPATILANFAKVQLICPYDSYTAVIEAVTNCSENLEVVFVDKETSRKVQAEGPHTLLAIGPKHSKPIELPTTPITPRAIASVASSNITDAVESMSVPPIFGVQNTIILREVKEGVTEDDIRELFDFEKCPPIQQVVEDISSFW
jgi:La domain